MDWDILKQREARNLFCYIFGAYKLTSVTFSLCSKPATITNLPSLSCWTLVGLKGVFLEIRMLTPLDPLLPGEKKA